MRGYDVHDRPGYDCHGLPIEVRVEQELGITTKREIEEKVTVEVFIERCKELAKRYERLQTEIFKRLGVWMDWDNPYLTYLDNYIESAWWTLKKANEKGLLEKGLRVVHWCPRCETALSGYEITDEYRVVRDPSIYVKFPVSDKDFILVWTTTPWTLPANMAIMVHPEFEYVQVESDGETYILAKDRCEQVFSEAGREYKVLKTMRGRELEGLKYIYPLLEEVPIQSSFNYAHRVILSEKYVTIEEGTGCVHVAPGHGEEDFEVGLEYKLPIFSPVDSTGKFTKEGGRYAGRSLKEANLMIIEDLRRKNLLFHEGIIHHKYPHCWRCKQRLVLRATEQWVIKVTKLKERMLEENERISWTPEWAGSRRFKDWLIGARDWVISRQRYWGIPMPIWVCNSCKRYEVIGSVSELREKAISIPPEFSLHKPWIDDVLLRCKCGGIMKRIPDVLDVWWDSGIAAWASIDYPSSTKEMNEHWPVDLIIEAHDQTRGWFYSQLVAGLIAFDRCPYKSVLMHGHVLDEKGRKMSKSLGTFIAPEDIVERYGADALRFYELQHTPWEDFSFKVGMLESVSAFINIMWNVYRFASMYMNLDKFNPNKWPLKSLINAMEIEDKWILSKTQSLIKEVTELMEKFHIYEVCNLLQKFMVEDVSRWYIKLIRGRAWMEIEDPKKLAAYAVMYEVLKTYLLLISPIMPFLTEALYQQMIRPAEPKLPESIHMMKWPEAKEEWIDEDLESKMEVARKIASAISHCRQKAKLKLRWPVQTIGILPSSKEVSETIRIFNKLLKSQANCIELKELNPEEIEKLPPSVIAEDTDIGKVFIDTERTPELLAESLAKEIIRRVQQMRKELDLNIQDYIDVVILAKRASIDIISKKLDYIKTETRSRSLITAEINKMGEFPKGALVKDWIIEGEEFVIAVIPLA